jgi:hypothetical protein
MALIQSGGISPNISGKMGAAVFAHNAGGRYVRNRAAVTNPNTANQQRVRSALATVSNNWTTLGQGDRDQWSLFASQVSWVNRFGESIVLSGIAMFTAANSLRVGVGLAQVEAGPTTYNLASLGTIESQSVNAGTLTLHFAAGDWNAAGGAMVVQASKPQNPSINFFNGPYEQVGIVAGGSSSPTSAMFTLGAAVEAGQKVFIRVVGTGADGRPTPVFRGVAVRP